MPQTLITARESPTFPIIETYRVGATSPTKRSAALTTVYHVVLDKSNDLKLCFSSLHNVKPYRRATGHVLPRVLILEHLLIEFQEPALDGPFDITLC